MMATVTSTAGGAAVGTSPPAPGQDGNRRRRRRDAWAATAFVAPSMLAFAVFVIVPALAGLGLSFFSWDLFTPPEWVGLDNLARLFGDGRMWGSLWVTLLFVLLGVVPTIVVGFMLAVLLNTRLPGVEALRVLYLAPMVASSAVAAVLWAYVYDGRTGLANSILRWVGIDGPAWLSDTTWALPALSLMMIWLALPLVMLLYLAGLQRIPDDIYAAAALDGAGLWRRLWSITWPNVMQTTVLVTVLQVINFISGSFETALIMTGGGPLDSTQTLALYAYRTAFEKGEMGYASALALFQLVLIGVTVGLVRLAAKLRSAT